jgi:CO/xanthine dehydrogenase Mo-binding subunit
MRTTWSTPTTPTCSTTWRASSASAGRRGGRTEAAAEAGCRLLEIDYECCPRCSTPKQAMQPGAPILHDKGTAAEGNIFVNIQGEVGSVQDGCGRRTIVHEKTYSTSRVQHTHLETTAPSSWSGPDGRIHVRTSTQGPFIAHQKLAYIFGINATRAPRVHRAGRRRLRRQAGDAVRGLCACWRT